MGGGGNSGNNMSHYQQQQQYLQNQAQYPSPMQQHQNHMNSFNYHPFGRMQQQQQPQQQMSNVIKTESDNDPYRFVDDDLSNGLNYPHHPNAPQHMSSPANFSPASSSPHMPPHLQQPQSGNATMMQYNEHHMSSPHHMHGLVSHVNHMGTHPQQLQSQVQPQQHMMNGGVQNVGMPAGMNPSNTSSTAMMMMNDTPKKRGRKKKMRDENG